MPKLLIADPSSMVTFTLFHHMTIGDDGRTDWQPHVQLSSSKKQFWCPESGPFETGPNRAGGYSLNDCVTL